MPPENELITFQCPKCGRFCAFKAQYAGRQARCLNCQTRMIIPLHDKGKAKRIAEAPLPPLKGFYAAALKKNARTLFAKPDSLAPLLFVCFLLTLKVFLGHVDLSIELPGFVLLLPLGWIVIVFNLLFLPWYAMQTVVSASLGLDELPDIYTGSFFSYAWELLRDAYFFLAALALSVLPLALLMNVLDHYGFGWDPLRPVVLLPALLLFPITLLLLSTGVDLTSLFRYDLFYRMIRRFPRPYLLVCGVTAVALFAGWLSFRFIWVPGETDPAELAVKYPLTLAAAVILLFAMRCVGLFGYHYMRSLPELWPID